MNRSYRVHPPRIALTLAALIALGLGPARVARSDPAEEYVMDFGSVPAGGLPPGWASWCGPERHPGAVAVAAGTAPVNPSQCLMVEGRYARAWLASPRPADAEVSVSLVLNSLSPAGVLARGSDLGGDAPSYYAAGVDRTMEVSLWKSSGGNDTRIASLKAPFLSDVPCRLTLSAQGPRLRVRLVRLDNGLFLDPSGAFQEGPAWCLDRTDADLNRPGLTGLIKHARYVERIHFDDFAVRPSTAHPAPPRVAVTAPAAGAVVRGVVTLRAGASADSGAVARTEFLIDGDSKGKCARPPYALAFNTLTLSNGPHVITARAYDLEGGARTSAPVTVTAANGAALPRPDLPRHYPHIRVAQFAYSGAQRDAAMAGLLRRSVDLVVAEPSNLPFAEAQSPRTPKLVYSNISSIYLNMLFDWLNWADDHGHDREAAFFHVKAAHRGTETGGSTRPVDQFWYAFRVSARGTDDLSSPPYEPTPVRFPAAGDAVYLGQSDRFREVRCRGPMNRPSASYALEYPSAADRHGRPTAWSPLALRSDTTRGFRAEGVVAFHPPHDWVTCAPAGSPRLREQPGWSGPYRAYFIRIRATTPGVAPSFGDVRGRDYAGWDGRHWTVPAFDRDADGDGDGYLSDTEYDRRAAGKDARFAYEGRLFTSYGPQRFATNPSDPHFQEWAADYHRRFLAAFPLADGLFMDNMAAEPPDHHGVVESLSDYGTHLAAANHAVWRAIHPKWILSNTVGVRRADPVVQLSPACYEESLLRPLTATPSTVADVSDLLASRSRQSTPAPLVVLDSRSDGSPSPRPGRDPRTALAVLTYYYLLASDTTCLNFFGGEQPSTTWADHWIEAAGYDVGPPSGPYSTFASGPDPADKSLSYTVFQRRYARALILFKPRSERTSPFMAGTVGDETTTTHDLGGTYRRLRADGTLGPPARTVTLRNGEGAILVPSRPAEVSTP